MGAPYRLRRPSSWACEESRWPQRRAGGSDAWCPAQAASEGGRRRAEGGQSRGQGQGQVSLRRYAHKMWCCIFLSLSPFLHRFAVSAAAAVSLSLSLSLDRSLPTHLRLGAGQVEVAVCRCPQRVEQHLNVSVETLVDQLAVVVPKDAQPHRPTMLSIWRKTTSQGSSAIRNIRVVHKLLQMVLELLAARQTQNDGVVFALLAPVLGQRGILAVCAQNSRFHPSLFVVSSCPVSAPLPLARPPASPPRPLPAPLPLVRPQRTSRPFQGAG